MYIALICDAYPPMRSSGAVQMRDLYLEFIKQGHQPTVVLPTPDLNSAWQIEEWKGGQIIRVKAPKTKDIGYIGRTIGEFWLPFVMLRNLRGSPVVKQRWDGIVWYSPTIFWGPLVKSLKKSSSCRGYLILRDIFPQWAVDIGLMRRGLPYIFFKLIENFQYSIADVIGIQTPANLSYFKKENKISRKVEVLQNWLADTPDSGCSISVSDSDLAGRKIFVYAGNMGVAQGMDILLDLAEILRNRKDIGFLFVGRGSATMRLKLESKARGLDNTAFYNEIKPSEIPGLYAQCHFGLIVLDPRHKTHNLPGKFLSYMQSGLPVLASINKGNDLVEIISKDRVGRVCTDASVETLKNLVEDMVSNINIDLKIKFRCKTLSKKMFSPKTAVKQIIQSLTTGSILKAQKKQLNKRLLFVVSEDWYFVSHRFHLAIEAIRLGYQVGLLSRFTHHRDIIKNAGIQVYEWSMNRGSSNPLQEIRSVYGLVSTIKHFQPDLLHAVAIKPVVYSALACRFTRVYSRVFALGGLGFVFSSRKRFAQIFKSILVFVFRILLSGEQTCLILQNPDDQFVLLSAGVTGEDKIRLIRGAGVDTNYFSPQSFPDGTPLILLPARMLLDKGVVEFVEAARTLNCKGINARFALVGPTDPQNPESVPDKQLAQWVKEGVIEWWGLRNDMPNVYRQATIVCLPSYREGLPKSLLEAASCGRPIITYDVPGCREIVLNGVNGILVPLKDQNNLLTAIEKLLGDSELCSQMGKAGRELAEKEFSQEKVAAETIKVWQEVLN